MKRRARGPGCLAFGRGLRHSLAFVHTLHRRCLINKESYARVASQLSLDKHQTLGVVRLLRSISYIPTFERLAIIAQRDPGLDDDDIAEMFGTTPEWSADVRERADDIRAREHIPMQYEILTDEDFMGADVHGLAAEVRAATPIAGRAREVERMGKIRFYAWRQASASFLPISID